ncbi:PQQ-binding-like beta-propeller repeat protein [Paenibacillus sp. Marseille-P2973]|uniref:stalk domain-containing protein n=1 Tax=Paenibacillus sp. Marseille-P2973 TaxID=1871032 RepID=UPI001B380480|nr:stalk domain-containing protein [Paenibacillus sp. Marseille-P2973]MBQ4899796.1 PQQ-binding-like beta-propeller repeat protein [Paenibacillus sp. Marseille-P2973]
MIRRITTGVFIVLLILSLHRPAFADSESYWIVLDGNYLNTDQAPINRDGSLYVPMRLIFESLQAKVTYLPKEGKIIGEKGDTTIELQIGKTTAYKNKQPIFLSRPPLLVKNSVYVPLRFISESLGASVDWKAEMHVVEIETPKLAVKTELPVINDRGKPAVLEHNGNMKLKWSFQDDSPYQQYEGFVAPDDALIFTNFTSVKQMDYNGKIHKEWPLNAENSPISISAIATNKGYTIKSNDTGTVWKGIPLYTEAAPDVFYPTQAVLDRSGNLLVVTTEGFAAYDKKGKRLWLHSQWKKGEESISAVRQTINIRTNASNQIFISYIDHLVVLNDKGEIIMLLPESHSGLIPLDNGTVLDDAGVYRIVNGTLQSVSSVSIEPTDSFQVTKDDKTLQKIDPDTGEILWVYRLPSMEEKSGYSFFPSTLTLDSYGTVYISTQGGTVHALDASDGKMKFKLVMNHGTISSSQVIPLSETELVVVNNNAIMFFDINEIHTN